MHINTEGKQNTFTGSTINMRYMVKLDTFDRIRSFTLISATQNQMFPAKMQNVKLVFVMDPILSVFYSKKIQAAPEATEKVFAKSTFKS